MTVFLGLDLEIDGAEAFFDAAQQEAFILYCAGLLSTLLLTSLTILRDSMAPPAPARRAKQRPAITIHTGEGNLIQEMVQSCPSLRKGPCPPFWCTTAWMQSLVLSMRITERRKEPCEQWERETFVLEDGQDVRLSWMWPDCSTEQEDEQGLRGLVLICHTVCGQAGDHVDLARALCAAGFGVVGMDRRGHGLPLRLPRFNTTGCANDLQEVLRHVRAKVPTDVPLLAVGFSAGSSLVATYLGKQGEASLVDCAVLVSPGFDMEAAFDTLHPVADAYVTKLAKDLWLLGQNEPVLRQCPAFEALLSARSMKEWHDHMYMVTGHGSRHEYFEDHNPAHRLQDICKPILYINSLDDFMFPAALVQPWGERLSRHCPQTAVVQTVTGGHCSFFDGPSATSWSDKVIIEFFSAAADRLKLKLQSDLSALQEAQ